MPDLARSPPPDPVCLAGRRVLIAEDETLIAMAYEALLQEQGCVVVGPAARVDEALALLAPGDGRPAPDAAVLDVDLGGEPSVPVAEALAMLGVPFVVLTGYAALPEELGGALRSAPRLLKPATGAEVTRVLADLAC